MKSEAPRAKARGIVAELRRLAAAKRSGEAGSHNNKPAVASARRIRLGGKAMAGRLAIHPRGKPRGTLAKASRIERKDFFMITAEHKASAPEEGNSWRCLPSEIDRIKRDKLATGYRIWIDPTKKDFELCLQGGDGFIVDFWLHMPRVKEWAEKHHRPLKEYVDEMVDMLLAYMKKYGNRVWWCLYGEHDNHVKLPRKFGSRQDVYEYMQALLTTSKGLKSGDRFPGSAGVGGKIAYNGMPQPFEYIKQRGIDFRKANIAVQCGLGSYAHYLYENGPRMAWMEINCSLGNVQVELAFLRGAARQYKAYWGIDMSSWGAYVPLRMTTVYDQDGTFIAGVHPSLWLREMLTLFLTGANLIHQEMTEISFWIDKKFGDAIVRFGHDSGRPEGWFDGIEKVDVSKYITDSDPEWLDLGKRALELSPTGKASQQMVDFARRYPDIRQHPYRPVALLMEFYHGWTQHLAPFNKVWYGNNDYEQGDYMVKAFFEAAFPDCLKRGDSWARLWASGLYPSHYGNEVKYNFKGYRALAKRGFDFRPYDDKELVSSRWGDSFDILLENCDPDILKEYPLVTLLGRIVPGQKLSNALLRYVRNGGTLLASTRNLGDTLKQAVNFSPVAEWTHVSSECLCCGKRFTENIFPIIEPACDTRTRRLSQTFDGRPLIIEKQIGKGKVLMCMAPYGLAGDNSLLNIVKHHLDHLITAIMPVEVRGKPVQWFVNTPPQGVVLTLINNSAEIWEGEVVFKKKGIKQVRDLWHEKEVAWRRQGAATHVSVSIDPFGFTVLCGLSGAMAK